MDPTGQPMVDTLLSVVATLQSELAAQREQAADSRREIARLVAMVEGLTAQLDVLLRDRAEERRAELESLRQEARATLEATSSPSTEADAGTSPPAPTRPPRKRDEHGRAPIPQDVPRATTRLQPQQCTKCQGTRLDKEKVLVSEEWDYVRAHLRARRTERDLCVCRDCNERVVPEQPPMPFDRASCTFSMMAWLCYAKVGLFLPLDRVQRDFKDQGAHIASSTLTRWWQRGADLLMPVAASMRMALLTDSHIRTDGTGLKVVFPRVKGKPVKGEARPGDTDDNGYLLPKVPNNGQILVFGNDEHAVFHYTPSKQGQHTLDFFTLGQDVDGAPLYWKGTITADAFSANDCLFVDGDRTEAGCNAHGLRKFRDDLDKAPLLASRALAYIDRFYAEEARARRRGLVKADLLAWRQEHIAPVTTAFRAWIDEHLTDLLPSNPVRKAMQYYVNHWTALTRFLEDPAVQLDNNWSERALRSVNLIRNNSLYAGGEDGAVRLCTLLTLVATSRLLKVNPYEYLEWALAKVVPHSANRGIAAIDLTPAAYKAAQENEAAQ
jgi:transposase